MKVVRLIARIITGLVFIFSGTVKAIDPMGSAYKFQDYFSAFNISFLKHMGLALAIVLCTAEFICGFSVLTGIRQRQGITGVMILMIIFTPLTFILALTNPVSDCGCFGDAIHLTNWQTFFKNVVLIIFAAILFTGRKKAEPLIKPSGEWLVIGGATALFIGFALYNLRYLPLVDFLPYKKGTDILASMTIPENAPADKYSTTFIYEKDGIKKEFDLSNYPANDSTWKFVEQRSVLLEKGYKPPIHDFSITAPDGTDMTQNILLHKGFSLLMISKKLPEARKLSILDGFALGKFCEQKGIDFYVLTASGTEEVNKYSAGLKIYSVDETALKTMIRSNPGYILLENGIIKEKWSQANLPEKEWFEKLAKE
jgi:uncharacterized membrane protein YphA (DoxX/SURF4 family)